MLDTSCFVQECGPLDGSFQQKRKGSFFLISECSIKTKYAYVFVLVSS